MAVTLIQAFEQTIEHDYALTKSGNMFEIVETAINTTNRTLKIGGCQGFGFSLDRDGRHPWQFIVNDPLPGIVSVCDGILVLSYNRKDYIIVLDLKSKKAGPKAFRQISAGISLCEWLCHLLNLNSHLTQKFEFIGVICKTRGSVSKQATRKGLNAEVDKSNKIPIITIANPGVIHIKDLVNLI